MNDASGACALSLRGNDIPVMHVSPAAASARAALPDSPHAVALGACLLGRVQPRCQNSAIA
ncbi:hypothetical protein XAR_2061 [Xanthomonas citri pv. glycines str. 8ra]|nr:hypothetical protein XAR_2061 [Xanthomonas citri pv. glycines str. 8ra]